MKATKKMIDASYSAYFQHRLKRINHTNPTVLTKNQCFPIVSASKKNWAPTRAWLRKSPARVAIHLNIENPAPVFNTNKAMTCWRNSPTITVGLWFFKNEVTKIVWFGSEPRHLTSMTRSSPKTELEDKKTKHAYCTVSEGGTLWVVEREPHQNGVVFESMTLQVLPEAWIQKQIQR